MRKGFTLIELLAVIVILAIIALIATPIILNIVENARKSASVSSANGYARAVANYLIRNEVDDGVYSVFDNKIKADYTGSRISNGSITIKDGNIEKANLCINDYSIDYLNGISNISPNDYCKDKNSKTLIIKKDNEQIESLDLGDKISTEIEKENSLILSCNNGLVLREEDNKIKVDNILNNSECNFSNSLEDIVENIDDTTNNMLLLNDITLDNVITINEGKAVVLDLNGNNVVESHGINNYGKLTLKNSGDLESCINATTAAAIVNRENATAELENIKFFTSTNDLYVSTISNHGKLTVRDCYIEGPFGIGDNESPTVKLNIYNSEIIGTLHVAVQFNNNSTGSGNIYSSTLKGKEMAVRFLSTGTLNIYSGTFVGETNSAINNESNGTINICSASISSNDMTLYNNSTGYIYYTSKVNLNGGNIYDVETNLPSHVILKEDLTCK